VCLAGKRHGALKARPIECWSASAPATFTAAMFVRFHPAVKVVRDGRPRPQADARGSHMRGSMAPQVNIDETSLLLRELNH
jgi:hypothetical protein